MTGEEKEFQNPGETNVVLVSTHDSHSFLYSLKFWVKCYMTHKIGGCCPLVTPDSQLCKWYRGNLLWQTSDKLPWEARDNLFQEQRSIPWMIIPNLLSAGEQDYTSSSLYAHYTYFANGSWEVNHFLLANSHISLLNEQFLWTK